MIDLAPGQLQMVKEILRRHLSGRTVWAFGSRVTGVAKPHSDLDLVIFGAEKLPAKTLSALNEAFAQSNLPMRVDIVDWNRISEEFQGIIKRAYVEL